MNHQRSNLLEHLQLGVFRVLALSVPLFIIFFVREFLSAGESVKFFQRLTDVVLLVAILKIGVDVYIPGARVVGGKVEVSATWKFWWLIVITGTFACSVISYILNYEWQMFLACSLVLNALLFAETSRLKTRFFLFYLFKAPSAYLSLFALLLLSGVIQNYSFLSLLFGVPPILYSVYILKQQEIDADHFRLSFGTLVSLLIVFLNWKEAFASRHFFGGDDLPAIVTYSRLTILTTFAFMIHNAQVPIRMRNHSNPSSANSLLSAAFKGRKNNLLWAFTMGFLIVGFSYFYEREYSLSVLLLMSSSVILVYIGNIVAGLVFVRAYKELIRVHVVSLCVFAIAIFVFRTVVEQTFLCISFSTFLAQFAFAFMLRHELKKWIEKAE